MLFSIFIYHKFVSTWNEANEPIHVNFHRLFKNVNQLKITQHQKTVCAVEFIQNYNTINMCALLSILKIS